MPNHCENDLYVTGKMKDLKAFKTFARGPHGSGESGDEDVLSAYKFVPMPDEFWLNELVCSGTEEWDDVKGGWKPAKEPCGFRRRLSSESKPFGEGYDKADQDAIDAHKKDCGGHLKDGFNRGGYGWAIEHWGTKWGLYDIEEVEGESYEDEDDERWGKMAYAFRTAWSPPIPVIAAMAAKFPELEFSLDAYEQGVGYQYHAHWQGGTRVAESEAPYHGGRGG